MEYRITEEKITEKAAVSLLGSMGTVFAGGKLATLIPFAPLQIPLAIGMTYGLGRVVMEWIKAGKPKDLSAFSNTIRRKWSIVLRCHCAELLHFWISVLSFCLYIGLGTEHWPHG